MKHIKSVDGLSGCYRGLTPKLIGSVIGIIASDKVAKKFGFNEADFEEKDDLELSEEELEKER